MVRWAYPPRSRAAHMGPAGETSGLRHRGERRVIKPSAMYVRCAIVAANSDMVGSIPLRIRPKSMAKIHSCAGLSSRLSKRAADFLLSQRPNASKSTHGQSQVIHSLQRSPHILRDSPSFALFGSHRMSDVDMVLVIGEISRMCRN